MPKRTDLKKIMIIGSGPIVIGQAAEFDYAGTQACLSLKEEGYEVILVNSNPATIMTDTSVADKVYMEPLTLEYVARILRKERPDAIVPGIGGQTGLNLAMQLEQKGVLKECQVELLGTDSDSIRRAEDREQFKELCQSIGEPVIPSQITYNLEEAKAAAAAIGYPVVLRPAFTLGGTGGGFADDEAQLVELGMQAFKLSPIHQVLIEKSVKGYKEIEFEVMRDASDRAITICGMENIDPVGVHTGDSAVVAPIMTLSDHDMKMLNDSAIKIIRALKIQGGCNVQFALNPKTSEYFLIEINPRVSRSSALASKASGYPIARVTAKVAVGMNLDEIAVANTTAAFEPSLDYVVAKLPRFPFDKFSTAANTLGTQMKATGEVMGIGSTLEECLLKSVRSLEIGAQHLWLPKFQNMTKAELTEYLRQFRDDGLFAVAQLLRLGASGRGRCADDDHAVLPRDHPHHREHGADALHAQGRRRDAQAGQADGLLRPLHRAALGRARGGCVCSARAAGALPRLQDGGHQPHRRLHPLFLLHLCPRRKERGAPLGQAEGRRARRGSDPHRSGRGV